MNYTMAYSRLTSATRWLCTAQTLHEVGHVSTATKVYEPLAIESLKAALDALGYDMVKREGATIAGSGLRVVTTGDASKPGAA